MELKMRNIGKVIGERYAALGYRGFFDIDFIISEKGVVYPIETNTRRTGGTHIFDLARYIFGNDWYKEIVVLSSDYFCYGKGMLSAENIMNKMSEILFPINGEQKGVVVIAVDSHKPIFAFAVIAPTKNEAINICARLTDTWNKDNLKL